MKKIVFNTMKISFATILSIVLAMYLELEFAISAGILTILTIQTTKRETIQTALERFYAFASAIAIAYICFMALGFNVYAFALYLVVYIFMCQCFRWYSSMAVNSVLISHFITYQSIEAMYIYNEFSLFFIGVGVGLFANMHLHQRSTYMDELKQKADEQIRYILLRMSKRILYEVEDYDGNCFEVLNDLIVKAKSVSIENANNTLFSKNTFDQDYIKMREHQTQILFEMYKVIRSLHTTPLTAHRISLFLERIANEYNMYNDCKSLLEEFYCIDTEMKSIALPTQRKEFEDRARLFTLLRLIEEFLKIKEAFIQK